MMFNSHGVRDNAYERSGHRDLDKEVGFAEGYHEGNYVDSIVNYIWTFGRRRDSVYSWIQQFLPVVLVHLVTVLSLILYVSFIIFII